MQWGVVLGAHTWDNSAWFALWPCACHKQHFHIIKWEFRNMVPICSRGFLQSFIQLLIFLLFPVLIAQAPLIFFTTFCLCRNRAHFLTSGLGGHQDLIAQKCNQIQATSSYLTAHNFLQHLCFYKLSKTMEWGFKAWQKDPKQPPVLCRARGGTRWSLCVPSTQQILWFCISFRIDFGEGF